MDQEQWKQAGCRLESWKRTMILAHIRPDGDALGAMGAMRRVITAAGREATAFVYDEVPDRYAFLESSCGLQRWRADEPAVLDQQFDGILILDTRSWQQLEPVADYLRASSLPRIVVDHHATGDELKGSGPNVYVCVVDAAAASTCAMVHAWCEAMNWPIDLEAAEGLFAGLATDTGWFRFSNTDAATLRSAAAMVEKGVRPDVAYARLEASGSLGRIQLKAAMLGTLTLHASGAVAVMWLTKGMFKQTGARQSDTEDLVNEPMAAAAVVVSVLLTEQEDGRIRVNFRSKSPEACGRDMDVAALAQSFGGGGHRRAAGARVVGTLDAVRRQVTEAAVAAVTSEGSC